MGRILILYGTTDGHTRKISETLAKTFKEEKCVVDLINAREASLDLPINEYDAVVITASIHAFNYQRSVKRWVRRHAAELIKKPNAFVSVSLGILEKRPRAQEDLQKILDRFTASTRWRPMMTKAVAGAVPYTRYGFLKKWMMKKIAAKAGGDTDTSRDYEYTDWDDLKNFGRDFVRNNKLSLLRAA